MSLRVQGYRNSYLRLGILQLSFMGLGDSTDPFYTVVRSSSGADPGINHERARGGAQDYDYNYEGRRGVHSSIALCNKVHERGCTCPLCTPLDPLVVHYVFKNACVVKKEGVNKRKNIKE